jgi:magnesium transporter
MYALVDTIIDFGFPLLETYSEQIQDLEEALLETKNERLLGDIHQLRRELLLTRRRLWPQRELVNELLRADANPLLSDTTLLHLRDCHDHVIAIMEMLETYHEMTSGLMELYLTSVSLKLNDVMKFLTIFTTIFIPPTFIVGLYGMNFNHASSPLNMPELNWHYGYFLVLGLIVACISGMLLFFKRKKWI